MSTLNLPDGVRTAVWRLVKARLKADAALSAVNLVFLDDDDDRSSVKAIEEYPSPTVRFVASLGRMEWYTANTQAGALVVSYEVYIRSQDDEDPLNLQEAIESAVQPDDNFVFQLSLVSAHPSGGATTGQPVFVSPLAVPLRGAGANGMLRPDGQFVFEVQRGFGG